MFIYLSVMHVLSLLLFENMAEPVSVLELDWKHRDGTKIYASVKIDHCYNQNKDLAPIVDSFCEDLALVLYQDLTPQEH